MVDGEESDSKRCLKWDGGGWEVGKSFHKYLNPIQAGLFWNHILKLGGTLCPPLCFSSVVQLPLNLVC